MIDTVMTRIVAPTGAVGFALFAEAHGLGLFNVVAMPAWVEMVLALLTLDLAIYLQHRLFHYSPVLWRLHRMHHSDLDVDVTTGARFHPIEILLSLGIKFVVIVPLGLPPLAVLLFEIGLNATSMFNHSNVRVSPAIERVLRCLMRNGIVRGYPPSRFHQCLRPARKELRLAKLIRPERCEPNVGQCGDRAIKAAGKTGVTRQSAGYAPLFEKRHASNYLWRNAGHDDARGPRPKGKRLIRPQ